MGQSQKTGRKNVYTSKIKPRFSEIAKWAKSGATEQSMAKQLGVAYSTFNKYKVECKEFSELLKASRVVAVEEIENAMFDAAVGGIKTIKKAMKVKKTYYEYGKKSKETEEVVPFVEDVYVPPNTTAGIYLLKHWAKDKGYTQDPLLLDLKREELEVKKQHMEKEDW